MKALRKEDYGTYECVLSNEIATLVCTFMILVDSTTPHAPLNLQVNTSVQAATVTWHPSYDGGYEQTYKSFNLNLILFSQTNLNFYFSLDIRFGIVWQIKEILIGNQLESILRAQLHLHFII